ncbi:MAG: N-acetylmuramoyl-L-alanine amidase [Planctomycetes bacterium]|nr:N-acetylmuramoyl-L-alanine amidase [Planctomycetota bacterium]
MISIAIAVCVVVAGVWWWYPQSRADHKAVTLTWYARPDAGRPIVLFLHGIGGDAVETWRPDAANDGAAPLTFMELLANDPEMSKFAIGAVNYDTTIVGGSHSLTEIAKELAREFDRNFSADNNLIIVAHSLGGVVTRLALSLSGLRDRDHQFVTLISLSSPFAGSELPKLARPLKTLGLPSRQLKALEPLSDALEIDQELWTKLLASHDNRIQQFAAAETRKIPGMPILVVDPSSSKFGVVETSCYDAPDDHISIAKPRSLQDGIGQQVKKWILDSFGSQHLHGEYDFRASIERPAGTTTFVAPGTTLRFRDGARFLVRGKLIAEGTAEAPIRVLFESTADHPSAVLLRGAGAADSSFVHCELVGGGGIRLNKPDVKVHRDTPLAELCAESATTLDETSRAKGGALCLVGVDRVRIAKCKFERNVAWIGGAILAFGATNLRVIGCEFFDNRSGYGGAALYAQASELIVDDCKFLKDTTGQMHAEFASEARSKFACGGALYLGERASAQIQGCTFDDCVASNAGGAVYVFHDFPERAHRVIIAASEFRRNRCNDKPGGALRVDGASIVSLDKDEFEDNHGPHGPNGDHVWDESDTDSSRPGNQSGIEGLPNRIRVIGAPPDVEFIYRQDEGTPRPAFKDAWMQNPSSFRSDDTRRVDTIVIHHTSAINWFESGFRKQYGDQLDEFERRTNIRYDTQAVDEFKYDWRLAKEIFELYAVSSHFLIDRSGTVYRLVPETHVAFHAGRSKMPAPDDRENVNDFSLGIELIATHPDDDPAVRGGREPNYTAAQYAALDELLVYLCRKYGIDETSVLGHDDIAGQRALTLGLRSADNVKKDPGPNFDWGGVRDRLRRDLSGAR